MYVLDYSNHQVREFSSTGKFLGAAGQEGRGPGDLFYPTGVNHDRQHSLYVTDRLNGVNRFDTGGGKPVYRSRFAGDYAAWGVCILGDRVIVAAWHDGHILHEFSADGALVRSFGEGWGVDTNSFVREAANKRPARVTCDEARSVVFVTAMDLGIVRAYSANGALLWQQELPDFAPTTFRPYAGGATIVIHHNNTFALSRFGNDYLVAAVRNLWRPTSTPEQTMEQRRTGRMPPMEDHDFIVYLLSARTGQVLTRQTKSVLLGDAVGDVAVAYEQNPFPRAYLVRVSEVKR